MREEAYNSRFNSQRKGKEEKQRVLLLMSSKRKSEEFFSVMDRIFNIDVRVPLKKVQVGVGKMKNNMPYFQIIPKEKTQKLYRKL